ncbi:galactose-3-O-sulfotransferase 2-like [Lingula anatina]|uniref:Galactose-3-O-sulfotransferase 2-like n=1 Tax=Lingula anatina TaxID=7574 RepID=A0A1S3K6P8_LINAN|nr:galactose-3-O-sulfotransferase 2-like [Lingula anatina]|eukprot:XP_013418177.1 galactose-3-O-sulfotransferase 2-like [Lingula anatina]
MGSTPRRFFIYLALCITLAALLPVYIWLTGAGHGLFSKTTVYRGFPLLKKTGMGSNFVSLMQRLDSGQKAYRIPEMTSCVPRRHIVFFRVSKCSSTTLYMLLQRAVVKYRLRVLRPKTNKIHFYRVHPYRPTKITVHDAKYNPKLTYDVLMDHMIYDADVINKMMPSDSFHLAILREPFAQFISAYDYFRLWVKFRVHSAEFLNHPHFYWNRSVSSRDKATYARNSMISELGFPDEREDLRDNDTFIQSYINFLDSALDFVIIVELLDECLVYLRRLLCWTMEDMLYSNANVQKKYRRPWREQNNTLYKEKHKRWSKADHQLYQHFLNKFLATLRRQGHDFFEELSIFRKAKDALDRCGVYMMFYIMWFFLLRLGKPFCEG